MIKFLLNHLQIIWLWVSHCVLSVGDNGNSCPSCLLKLLQGSHVKLYICYSCLPDSFFLWRNCALSPSACLLWDCPSQGPACSLSETWACGRGLINCGIPFSCLSAMDPRNRHPRTRSSLLMNLDINRLLVRKYPLLGSPFVWRMWAGAIATIFPNHIKEAVYYNRDRRQPVERSRYAQRRHSKSIEKPIFESCL